MPHALLFNPHNGRWNRTSESEAICPEGPEPDLNPGLVALASAPAPLLRKVLPQPHTARGLLGPQAPAAPEGLPPLQGHPLLALFMPRLEGGVVRRGVREGSKAVRSSPGSPRCCLSPEGWKLRAKLLVGLGVLKDRAQQNTISCDGPGVCWATLWWGQA